MIAYAVYEREWQYNDEIYYAEGDGGRAIKVFRTEEKANKFAKKEILEFLSNESDGPYVYGEGDIDNYPDTAWEKANPEERLKIWKDKRIAMPFFVDKVEVEE